LGQVKPAKPLQKERSLFEDTGLTGVGCRKNYRDVRISAADMFVDSTSRYGLRAIDLDSRSKDLTKTEKIYHQMIFRTIIKSRQEN
jgi:transposase-like protein